MGVGAAMLVGSLVSTGLAVYGAKQEGKAAQSAARYNNALAQREANNLEAESTENIARQRINNRRQMSTLRARAAGSNIISTSGSSALVLEDAAGSMQIGIADAARSAGIQSESIRQKGKMALYEGDQAKAASKGKALAIGISGLTSAAGSAYGNYRVGNK